MDQCLGDPKGYHNFGETITGILFHSEKIVVLASNVFLQSTMLHLIQAAFWQQRSASQLKLIHVNFSLHANASHLCCSIIIIISIGKDTVCISTYNYLKVLIKVIHPRLPLCVAYMYLCCDAEGFMNPFYSVLVPTCTVDKHTCTLDFLLILHLQKSNNKNYH